MAALIATTVEQDWNKLMNNLRARLNNGLSIIETLLFRAQGVGYSK